MRTFEVLIVVILTLFVFSMFVSVRKRNRWFHLLPGFSLIMILIQILVEGQCWQMYPIYFFSILLFIFTAKNIKHVSKSSDKSNIKDRKLLHAIGAIVCLLFLFIITLPPLMMPVFKLPNPSGPYAVGIKYDYLIDKSRLEILTPEPDDFMEVSVQVWYPAEIKGHMKPVKYWENAAEKSKIISKFWGGLPSFLFSHFSLIQTHSYLNADLLRSKQKFPVLIFNHGSIGLPSINTVLMEELASQGYIIFSIGHADYIPFFIKPDGQIKAFDPNSKELQLKMKENDDPEVRHAAYQLMKSNDLKEQEVLFRKFLEKNPQNQKSLQRWIKDISFTMDELERINKGKGIFSGRLDLSRLGVFGVSFGGAASTQICVHEKRCKVAINIDCPQFGDLIDQDISQPIMFMSSEQYKGKNDIFFELKNNPLYMISVKNTTHQNFSDISIWGSLFKIQLLGKIDGKRFLQILNTYTLAFFDKHLRGKDNPLLKGPSPDYPEVEIKVKNVN